MDYKYKLSICMMVKNEEKNLHRCLDSFKKILEDISCELIIIDTGSDDSSVDIAKQYTDKVYFHEWNNHFSDMRNISISYAVGEWIMILDADECLEGSDELYNLFMNQEIKSYNTILVKLKNYLSVDETSNYSILAQPRIFRNDGTFKYEGTVHNQPIYKSPILDTEIFFGHYGYVSSDKELMERKFQRTATLLKEELEKNPTNIYYQFQLSVSYSMYGDNENAYKEIKKAYKMLEGKSKEEKNIYLYVYGMYTKTLFRNENYYETIKISKESLLLSSEYLDIHFILANAYLKIGQRLESIYYFKKHIELVKTYEKLNISNNPGIIMYTLDTSACDISYINISSYYYDTEEYKKSYYYVKKIKDNTLKYELLCRNLIKLKKYEELYNTFKVINEKENQDIKNKYLMTLEKNIKDLSDMEKDKIRNIFSKSDEEYGLFNKINLQEEKTALIKQFFNENDINDLPIFYSDIYIYLKDNERLMISLFKKVNSDILRQQIGKIILENKDLKKIYIDYLIHIKDNIRPNDHQANRIYVIIANAILIDAIKESKNKNLEKEKFDIFKLYLEKGFNYLNYIYDMKKIRVIYNTLEKTEDKFFMIMYLANESIENNKYQLAIKYIRQALNEFPHMAIALNEYQKEEFKDFE